MVYANVGYRTMCIEFDSGILHKYLLITGSFPDYWKDISYKAINSAIFQSQQWTVRKLFTLKFVCSSEFQVQKSVGQYKTWALDWTVDWTLHSIMDSIIRLKF